MIREKFQIPVSKICKLVGVEKVTDISNDEILYKAVENFFKMNENIIDIKSVVDADKSLSSEG